MTDIEFSANNTSNFEFLNKYWPDIAQIGATAEGYLYSDPNACIYKLGMVAERIADEIFVFEHLELPEEATQANKLKILQREKLLPVNIDDIFYALRKARNDAVHSGEDSKEKAGTLLKMTHTLACWFMEVYGDWNFKASRFVMPVDLTNEPGFEERIRAQEEKIKELSEQIAQIGTAASNKSREERSRQAETVSDNIDFSESEESYLMGEQVRLEIDMISVVNYALQQNGIPVIKGISIRNNSGTPIEEAELYISTKPEMCLSLTRHIELVPANSKIAVKDVKLELDGEYLAGLTEKITGTLNCTLVHDGEVIANETMPLTALTYDEWHGYAYYPELVSAFVTPNHPEIAKIAARSAELLGSWTGDPSLDAYQSKDVNRVLKQAAAVYSALHEQNIVYSVPPASFEKIGQRVRTCDTVLQQKMGTCLDLSLLYASCLEAIGLNPLLVLQDGHIFAGLWLEDMSFSESVQDDVSLVTKRLAEGINEIAVVECTAFVAGRDLSFDEARKAAEGKMQGTNPVEYVVDVKRARLSGVKPIPMRVLTESGWQIIRETKDDSSIKNSPSAVMGAIDIDNGPQTPVTRKLRWERKLLDIGMRNTLINMRISKSIVPILSSSLDELEDSLSDGSDFSIASRPSDWHLSDGINIDTLHELGQYEELVRSEFKNKRLRSILSETELEKSVKELYRAARTSIEENGANTLFLALGLVKWYENPRSTKPRYAPIILVPIEMVRKSVAQGYVIRLRDDEPQMNITMLEKFKQDFGIIVEGLDVLPEDEHGIDTRKVFTIMRKAVMEQKNWDVLESAFLGLFSFSQFVMWNDIRNRSEELEKNAIVRSLMNGRLCWDAKPMEIGDKVSEEEVLLPISADASQLYAIDAAGKGESFVLHGPPGTGKSQTITAMIANALALGKTVLFVAEKMAALEVVQKRLENMGIGAFCLELHSNKSKKKDVLEQLRQASEVTKQKSPEMFKLDAERISKLRSELDAYASTLHKKQQCGLSLYELINEYVANKSDAVIGVFEKSVIENMDQAKLEEQTSLVERVVAAAKVCGHPHNHPLSMVECREYSQQMRILIPQVNENYKKSINKVKPKAEAFAAMIQRKAGSFDELSKLNQIAKEILFWLEVPMSWAQKDNFADFSQRMKGMAETAITMLNHKKALMEKWREEFLLADGKALLDEYQAASVKWALPKMFGISGIRKKLMLYTSDSNKPSKAELPEQLLTLVNYQQTKAIFDESYNQLSMDLGDWFKGDDTDWNNILEKISMAVNSSESLRATTMSDEFRKSYCGNPQYKVPVEELLSTWDEFEKSKGDFDGLFCIRQQDGETWLADQIELIASIESHYDDIKEWITWNGIAAEACENGLTPVIDAYRAGMRHDDVVRAYRCEICQELAMKVIDSEPVLSTFSGAVFNEKISQFMKLDSELQKLTRQEIYCRLAANVPNFATEASQSSELGILQKAIKSNGRGTSIRKLFEQIPNMLPRLCPCMLMSPISAAQYLDPKRKPFDMVVFDEASQLPTCKAVGALARGNSAIVVGDPKQMPPTSFFATNAVDEENIEAEDLESILDDCLALNMPQTHLLWHYRSRHESLIAFSNYQFYENRLYTFPSVNDREAKVRLVHVDGKFDRGKTRQNRAEAEAVVAEIVRRCHDEALSTMSIGVVTFNIMQQNLIDDLLTEACKNDPELESWAFNSEEPLFIKNLENVQGDERDVILFSVGYGPDSTGKVSMNFGPLNREGGWRRLNVAVSRARCEMVVFSTLEPEQINLSRTSAEGVIALRKFLEYADGQELSEDDKSAKAYTSARFGVINAICDKLEEAGYDTDRMVGHSEYKIDIGVIDPKNPEQYLCGIMLDGATYGSAKTTRDREVAQVSVLNGLGWSILRIWSMDWWDNSSKEIKRILEFVQKSADEGDNKKVEASKGTLAKIEKMPDKDDKVVRNVSKEVARLGNLASPKKQNRYAAKAKGYVSYSMPVTPNENKDFMETYNGARDIRKRLNTFIEYEGPISERLLFKKVVQSFGLSRTGPRMLEALKYEMNGGKMTAKKTVSGSQTFYWFKDQDPQEYYGMRATGEDGNKRDIQDVPPQEMENAICYVLKEQISLPDSELAREAAKLMGYLRMNSTVDLTFRSAIQFASEDGMILKETNDSWILTEKGTERAEKLSDAVELVLVGTSEIKQEKCAGKSIETRDSSAVDNSESDISTDDTDSDPKQTKKSTKYKVPFYLNPNDGKKFQYKDLYFVSEIRDELNRITSVYNVKHLFGTDIYRLLMEKGYVEEQNIDGRFIQVQTESGLEKGIKAVEQTSKLGNVYTVLMYPPIVQKEIVEYYTEIRNQIVSEDV